MTRAALCACVPAALGAFDFGLLALAGPRMAPALGVTGDAYPWLFSASSFAYGAAVMPAAALTARLGPVRALVLGLVGLALGVAALAVSWGLAATLAARVVFGLGGALAAIAALAVIGGRGGRATGFAALGGAVAVGFAAGTLIGAVTAWRLVLLIVAAFVLVAAATAARLPGRRRTSTGSAVAGSPPTPTGGMRGAAPLTAAIVLVAAAVATADAGSWAALPLSGCAVLSFLAFRRRAPRVADGAGLAAACFAGAATTATGVGATILIGPALTDQQLPSSLLAVFGLGVVPGALLARRLVERAGPPTAASAGIALQALALVAVALAFAAGAPALAVAAALVCFGAAHVAANAGAAAAALRSRPAARSAALLIASQYVGGGVGPLATASIADAHGAPTAILAAAGVAAVGAVPGIRATKLMVNIVARQAVDYRSTQEPRRKRRRKWRCFM
jgi:MFS family permease